MVHGAEHLVVGAVDFVPMRGFRAATIGRIRFCNHDCGTRFPRQNSVSAANWGSGKPIRVIEETARNDPDSYTLDRAPSLMPCAGFSLPSDWNSMSGNCSTARRSDCSQLEWIK